MKKSTWLTVATLAALTASINLQPCQAQDVSRVFISATGVSTNQSGHFVYHQLGNRDLIRQCANEQGLTNLTGLSLVYDHTADAVEVVSGTNHAVVCAPLSFAGGTWLSNTNGTRIQRLSYVYWETNQVASGTLAASEYVFYGPTNQLRYFSLRGRLQLALPGDGTNSPVIYNGSIAAGSGFFFEEPGEFEHDARPGRLVRPR